MHIQLAFIYEKIQHEVNSAHHRLSTIQLHTSETGHRVD